MFQIDNIFRISPSHPRFRVILWISCAAVVVILFFFFFFNFHYDLLSDGGHFLIYERIFHNGVVKTQKTHFVGEAKANEREWESEK